MNSPRFTNYNTVTGFSDIDGEDFTYDFGVKLQFGITDDRNQEQEETLSNRPVMEDEEEIEYEEEEFSFVSLKPDDGSPISAEDLFRNGQIRTVFPLFNQDLIFADEDGSVLNSEEGDVSLRPPLMKLFVEDSSKTAPSSDPAGPYCEWKRDGKTVKEITSSPERCKKSNSTGFSKLWRVRDLIHRSSSDGKDAFVFLNHPPSSVKTDKKNEKQDTIKETEEKPSAKKERSGKTAPVSAHEKLYVKNRAIREGDKRRSYLPYKQVGFFANVNGLSRNVHPF